MLATSGRYPASRYERVHRCWWEIANPIACNGRFCLKQNRVAINFLTSKIKSISQGGDSLSSIAYHRSCILSAASVFSAVSDYLSRTFKVTGNPSKLEVCVIGSGTGIPHSHRRPPALVARIGDHLVLFDCGAGTLWGLAEVGLDFRDLDWLWFSHFHPDHTGDLVPLLFASRSPLYGREKPLVIGGAAGLQDFYQRLHTVYGQWIELDPALLTFKEIDPAAATETELPFGRLISLTSAPSDLKSSTASSTDLRTPSSSPASGPASPRAR